MTAHPLDLHAAATVEATRFGNWMQTFTGGKFWPMDPRSDEVHIADIAHSLSMQCRYAGHCLRFYSVAEHSVHVARWLQGNGRPDGISLQGLLHDAPEAYLVDVPRPVKPFLTGYYEAERCVWNAVAMRFRLPHDGYDYIVKEADNRILNDERAQNMSPCTDAWGYSGEPLGVTLQFWSPDVAEAMFLNMFTSLTAIMGDK